MPESLKSIFGRTRGGKSRVTVGGASGLPPDLYQAEFKKLGALLERALNEGKGKP